MELLAYLLLLVLCVANGMAQCQENYVQCGRGGTCVSRFCASGSVCIYHEWMCSASNDCSNGWDQERCGCGWGKFKCDNACYYPNQTCDGIKNCQDDWDEIGCNSCNNGAFLCSNSRCIRPELRCDGIDNCTDGSDEIHCTSCNGGAFHCSDTCVRQDLRCDGIPNCNDGSDELHCNICNGDAFHCSENHCVPREHVCDKVSWCTNGSDEANCSNMTANYTACPAESRCNGVEADCAWHDEVGCTGDMCRYPASTQTYCDGRCLHADQMCDGKRDCQSGYDEDNCKHCSRGGVFCDGACREAKHVCDGVRDCLDGLDEADCTSCNNRAFMCDGHQCVHYTHRCDGVRWCLDGTDELNCNNVTAKFIACPAQTRCNGLEGGCFSKDDEIGCIPIMCQYPANETTFCDGRCLPASKWCDGVRDCLDLHDEQDCLDGSTTQLSMHGDDASTNLSRTAAAGDQDVLGLKEVMRNSSAVLSLVATSLNYMANTQNYTANAQNYMANTLNYMAVVLTIGCVVVLAVAVVVLSVVVWKFKDRCCLHEPRRDIVMMEMEESTT